MRQIPFLEAKFLQPASAKSLEFIQAFGDSTHHPVVSAGTFSLIHSLACHYYAELLILSSDQMMSWKSYVIF